MNPGKVNSSFAGRTFAQAYNNCVINAAGTGQFIASGGSPCQNFNLATASWRQAPTNPYYLSNIPPFFGGNRFAAPPYANATIFKAFQITERAKAEIRLLGENITNTPYFTTIASSTPTAATFGQLTNGQQNDPRSLQLTARFSF